MATVLTQLAPSITNLIRLDHTHVAATFHQYETTLSDRLKRGIVDSVCLSLETHAQLEEEIFYPVLRLVFDNDLMRKSPVEHDEMRTLIARLRQMVTTDPMFDESFFELMRLVMHHVADEESQLLPAAERLIPEQLQDMGARFAKRRFEMMASRGGEYAGSFARSLSPRMLMSTATTLLNGGFLMVRHGPMARPWTRRSAF
ncbi:hemerythrin domain-containing protein [Ramlibacter albus]|uniref:Hemerythrin domain-containing protein n=1 Tax=Ramlibacter albus TaxID=2079448 RepID=A0A923S2B1_9BURK|nr:hemerythrin domain-containing protein [Ramlibacter albus]MBC5765185.1 hemerythrin domain-containing protein [Ramlibacter albus]